MTPSPNVRDLAVEIVGHAAASARVEAVSRPAWPGELFDSSAAIERQLAELQDMDGGADELLSIRQALTFGAHVIKSIAG
jgi:hypothetical protein